MHRKSRAVELDDRPPSRKLPPRRAAVRLRKRFRLPFRRFSKTLVPPPLSSLVRDEEHLLRIRPEELDPSSFGYFLEDNGRVWSPLTGPKRGRSSESEAEKEVCRKTLNPCGIRPEFPVRRT